MASTRLNQHHRRMIRNRLMGGRFKEEREALNVQEAALALEAHRDALGDEYEAILAAPRHWFKTDDDVCVRIAGTVDRLKFPKDNRGNRTRLPYPASNCGGVNVQYDANHSLTERYREIERRRAEIDEEERRLKAEIGAILNSATTAKALCDKWPEIRMVVEEVVNEYTPNLPAVQVGELNKKLGLSK